MLVATVVLIFNSCIKTKEAQVMLNENIKNLRKTKGLSQEELAIKLNVVRQTVSKWEKGLSVPDSSMLISLADELDTSVSILLGETVQEHCLNELDLKSISEKLESINLQFAKRSEMRIRIIRYLLISFCAIIIIVFIAFATMHSEYLNWDYNIPELAVEGTMLHGVEFLFVRFAPFVFIGSIIGIVFTYRKR
ncbi:helix-turn-helix domain-containing protein [Clostridioides sp. ZZV15-6383]|uniref:helix-turn-helix domain-containing protein n=1 Tax=Clostridioides sp. ZZV15-6383 TaxID=2811498 RepID=UPI0039BC5714